VLPFLRKFPDYQEINSELKRKFWKFSSQDEKKSKEISGNCQFLEHILKIFLHLKTEINFLHVPVKPANQLFLQCYTTYLNSLVFVSAAADQVSKYQIPQIPSFVLFFAILLYFV
jgi:hypothetical protein